jgi:Protein of unknown function (DUF402)
MWSSGDAIALREIWKGRVWKARACTVVQDEPDLVVLWLPRGAPTKIPPGSGIPRAEWTLEDGSFRSSALRLARPGARHSILLFFDGAVFRSWYVNIERPLRRSHFGFDYLDLELDVRVDRDGSWRLEDDDELEEAQRLGVLDATEAAEVRAEAERVIDEWPFPTGWEDWRPDPGWELPQLPPGWDVVG